VEILKKLVKLGSVRTLVVIGVGGFVAFAAIGVALATDSNTTNPSPGPTASSSNFGIGGKTWASIGAEEFATLPKGTLIVDCFPNQKQLPAGSRFESNPGLTQMRPGLHFLSDGRCALDPNATPIPIRQDNVDPKFP
jgi:hypothetical protein